MTEGFHQLPDEATLEEMPHMGVDDSYGGLAQDADGMIEDGTVSAEAEPAAAPTPAEPPTQQESEEIYDFLMDMQNTRHNTAMTTINNMR
ncbi:hypothetical protein SMC26_10985 [Actinomadura fulvescens]|uniref:Uncharacterized protein n=1 Tax=Actinomadura fulvescens TaxID=46160 RepID=A0ABP6C958_9ACTN